MFSEFIPKRISLGIKQPEIGGKSTEEKNHLKRDILMALMNDRYMSTDIIPLLTMSADYYNSVRRNLLKDKYL